MDRHGFHQRNHFNATPLFITFVVTLGQSHIHLISKECPASHSRSLIWPYSPINAPRLSLFVPIQRPQPTLILVLVRPRPHIFYFPLPPSLFRCLAIVYFCSLERSFKERVVFTLASEKESVSLPQFLFFSGGQLR